MFSVSYSHLTTLHPSGAYDFTTLFPNLGVYYPPFSSSDDYNVCEPLALCDVPGLVEGASKGVGLGLEFLRHVEKCEALLHFLDCSSPDLVRDYQMLNSEMMKYDARFGSSLTSLSQIVVCNKIDLVSEERLKEIEHSLRQVMSHKRLLFISTSDRVGVDALMGKTTAFVAKVVETKRREKELKLK